MDKALTEAIPRVAMLVVKLIRKRVKRPKDLPRAVSMIHRAYLRWRTRNSLNCPMGLDHTAMRGSPLSPSHFRPNSLYRKIGNGPIRKFADWWDKQTDAQAATDAVWGKKKP